MTYIKKESPGAVGAATGAKKSTCNQKKRHSNSRPHAGQGPPRVTFAEWCRSNAPHALNLDPELVAWLCRVMAAPEMRGISNLEELHKALRLRRTKLRFPDELQWNRLCLTAKTMWLAHGGKI
jgi:hypothetical protein